MATPRIKTGEPTLKPGWWVALTLKAGTAPQRSYVGQIQAIDARGLRLTMVDWLTGDPVSWDLFVSHENLESALVATDKHDLRAFGDPAGQWQEAIERGSEPRLPERLKREFKWPNTPQEPS
jgi:hypothetical protein